MKLLVELLWGYHVIILILLVGIKTTISSKFFQIRKFHYWIKECLAPPKKSDTGISSFQALCTALAGSIGTGNIVGVGLAISIGGAGSIFWMWVSALFGMMTVFTEVSLSAKYKTKSAIGAFAYIKRVGKGKLLPFIYGLGCVLSSLAMGNMAQSNSFAKAGEQFGIPNWASGIFLAIILFLLTSKGIKSVVKLTEKIVPLMTIIFFVISMSALIKFNYKIPTIFNEIITEAFTLKAGAGGGIFLAMKTGISRGVFTNEAGLGSSSMTFSNVKNKTPIQLGCLGIFQVFMDTTVMCTITAFTILCCTDFRQGDFLALTAFNNAFGTIGFIGINLCMALFAFATMTTTSYYGKVGINYISKGSLDHLFPFLFAISGFCGAVMSVTEVFDICDAFNGLMAIPNLIGIIYHLKEIPTITLGSTNITASCSSKQ